MSTWRAAIAAFAVLASAAVAHAGNDDSILLGNDAALTGGAVVSTVNDGSALWYNPAGLARAQKDSVDVGASAFALRKYNIPEFITGENGARADASFVEIVTIPSALTFVRRINESAVFGLALFASQVYDFALRSSYDATDPSNDLRFRIQTVSTAEIARYHLAGGVGFKLPHNLSVGVALLGDYGALGQSQTQSSDAGVGGNVLAFAVESALVQQTVLGFHLRAGIAYRPIPDLSLGLSVESPSFYFYRNTRLTQISSFTNLVDDAGPVLTAEPLDSQTTDLDFGLYLPVRVRFGGAIAIGAATLAVEADVQSKLDDDAIDAHRDFVWNLRMGGEIPVREGVRLGAGLFTDRAADRKDIFGAGPIHFYGATLGGEYQNVRWLEREASATERSGLTFSTTIALRYAYGTGKFAGSYVNIPNIETVATDISVHELTLHIGSGVYF